MNNEPTPILRDVLIGMGAVSLALMSLASDEEKRDEDFFQQVYYAMLAANDILEVIRMLREYRDHQPWEQTYISTAEKRKRPSDDEESEENDLPTAQSPEQIIPEYNDEDAESDEDYDEEYARNHGEDDYDEDEQGWGMGMGM